MSRSVKVYRSSIKQNLYIFVAAEDELSRVPDDLLRRFGKPVEALSIELDVSRELARADASTVLNQIRQNGYYLQLPPTVQEW